MATRKTVPSVSDSNKPNTNKESVSYLVLYVYKEENETLKDYDLDSYLIVETDDPKRIIELVRIEWNSDIEIERLRILPFKLSEIKRIKQTVELV